MDEFTAIVTYAFRKAVAEHNVEIIQYCLNRGVSVTVDDVKMYIISNDMIGETDLDRDKDGFMLLLNNLPDNAVFDKSIIHSCIGRGNSYYLETILATQKYQHESLQLPHINRLRYVTQDNIRILSRYGIHFGPSIMQAIRMFQSTALLNFIAAGVNLNPYQPEILKFFTKLHQLDPRLGKWEIYLQVVKEMECDAGSYRFTNICEMLNVLISYLTSNQHSITHYLIVKYFITDTFTEVADVSKYILDYYIQLTVGFHVECINYYRGMTKI